MRCPECEWNVVSFVLDTQQWVCKRCKHEWIERKKSPSRVLFDQPTAVSSRQAARKGKGGSLASQSKRKSPRGKTKVSKRRH